MSLVIWAVESVGQPDDFNDLADVQSMFSRCPTVARREHFSAQRCMVELLLSDSQILVLYQFLINDPADALYFGLDKKNGTFLTCDKCGHFNLASGTF